MEIKEKVKGLPEAPGVYLMKNSENSIIYVGKSKNLRSRVGSYFVNSKAHSPKVVNLVNNLKDFDYILTDTEFEAFMLECSLIKEIKPYYNKKMKSPSSYTYININMDEKYPSFEISGEQVEGCLSFGPYNSYHTVERGLQGIKEYCKIPCKNINRSTSACLNYSMGLCIGVCSEASAKASYPDIISKIIGLLSGNDNTLLEEMNLRMDSAAKEFDFEAAAKYRDYINSINYLIAKENVKKFSTKNQNIVVIENLDPKTIKFFLIRGNRVLYNEKIIISDEADIKKEILEKIKSKAIKYFREEPPVYTFNIGKNEIDEVQIIYSYLKSKGAPCKHVVIPQKIIDSENNLKMDKLIDKLF